MNLSAFLIFVVDEHTPKPNGEPLSSLLPVVEWRKLGY